MSDHSTDVLRGLAATQWQCTTQACPDCAAAQQRIAELEQVSGDVCPACGWAGIRAGEPCAFCQQGQYIDRIAELEQRAQQSDSAIRVMAVHLINQMGYPDEYCDPEHPEVVTINLAIARGLVNGPEPEDEE